MHFVTLPQTTCAHITARAEREPVYDIYREQIEPLRMRLDFTHHAFIQHIHTHMHTHTVSQVLTQTVGRQAVVRNCAYANVLVVRVASWACMRAVPASLYVCVCELLCVLPSRARDYMLGSLARARVCAYARVLRFTTRSRRDCGVIHTRNTSHHPKRIV